MSEWFLKAKLVDVVECLPTGVEAYDGEKSYYSTGSVQDESIVPEGRFTHKNKPSRANRLARKGDVLQARMKKTDKGHLVGEQLNEQLISTGFIQVRPYEKTILSEYVFYYLKSWEFLSQRDTFSSGSTQEALTDAGLLNISFPLVGPLTQNRIVQKIEELFSEIDAGTEALKRVEANLKRYRASVLKAACEGKLVPTEAELARKEGREYEHASVLLERILKERREKWQKENPGKKYKEPKAPDTKDLPKLPEGWVWASAEQLSAFITKGTTPSANKLFKARGDIPFIKVYNLTFVGELDFTIDPTFVSNETHNSELSRSKVLPGDILMNIVGPPLGKISVVPSTYPEWNMNQAVVRYRPLNGVSRDYFKNLLFSEKILNWATRKVKATAGQFNLTLEICRDLPIPLAPFKEQLRISSETDKLISQADVLSKQINIRLGQKNNLKQSILKKAFNGELVTQDPNDEPASVLLERIKEERATREVEAKNKKTITRKPKAKKKTS